MVGLPRVATQQHRDSFDSSLNWPTCSMNTAYSHFERIYAFGITLSFWPLQYTEIINSGRFLEIGPWSPGTSRSSVAGSSGPRSRTGLRTATTAASPSSRRNRNRDAHLPPEHRRRASTLLPGPGRAKGLRAVRSNRLRDVEGVRGRTRLAVATGRHVRSRGSSGSGVPSREIPALGPRERDGRGRTRGPDR